MASMLCLAYIGYPTPKPECNLPTSINNARGNKLHFRLNHTSPPLISASEYIRRGQTGQRFQPVFCDLDDRPSLPSGKDENDSTFGRGFAGASLVFAAALGLISAAGFSMNSRALADPRKLPTKAPQSQEVYKAGLFPFALHHREPSLNDVKKEIIGKAYQLMAEEKFEEAEKFLLNKYNEYEQKKYSQVLNDVDLALVTVLIKLEKYKEASTRKCLEDEQFTRSHPDALLYKAVIFAKLQGMDAAIELFKKYVDAVDEAIPNPLRGQ